ncbi:hypothetical protein ACVW0P_001114 [Mucilaginibacter sp. UYNi724]
MKKLLLLSAILCGLSITSFAQTSPAPRTAKWNFGFEAGLPLGHLHEAYSSVFGAYAKYEYPVFKSTFITASTGYRRYFFTDELKQYTKSVVGEDRSGVGSIPIMIGVKHYFGDGLFAEGQIGKSFYTRKGSGSSFDYDLGVGYTFRNGIEISARYQGFNQSNVNTNIAAIRLGFRF